MTIRILYIVAALGIWAMLYAGYGIPSIDKRYIPMSGTSMRVGSVIDLKVNIFVEGIREYKVPKHSAGS